MNKNELVLNVSAKSGISKKDATTITDAILNEITQSLALGEDVNIVGFGKFSVVETSERTGRNPSSGAEILISAGKKPKFKASQNLKTLVNT